MPPATKKDYSVILFDAGIENSSLAIKALAKICAKKFFSMSKDLTKLILTNCEETKNRLSAQHGGYEHIYETMENPASYEPKFLLDLLEKYKPAEADWLEALAVAIKTLLDDSNEVAGIVTLQLLFITDLRSNSKVNPTRVQKIIDDLKNLEIFLYIIGPEVEVPSTIKNTDDIKQWMTNLEVPSNDENLSLAKKIVVETGRGVVCDYKMGVQLFFAYKNWPGKQPWQVPLSVGTKIELPAQTMRVLEKGMVCKLVPDRKENSETIWIDAEDETVEIAPEDVICGISRHEKFVQLPDAKMFKCENPKSFRIMCFTDSSNVPEYFMGGEGSYFVFPNSTPKANKAMEVLIDCLAHQDKYAIARRVYAANYDPKFVVLVPKADHNPRCFILAHLPYENDVRYNYQEKSAKAAPKIDVESTIYDYLDFMDVDNTNNFKKLSLGIPLLQDVNCDKVVNKAAEKYLGRDLRLEQLELDYVNEELPPQVGEALRQIWPERTDEEISKASTKDDGNKSDEDFKW